MHSFHYLIAAKWHQRKLKLTESSVPIKDESVNISSNTNKLTGKQKVQSLESNLLEEGNDENTARITIAVNGVVTIADDGSRVILIDPKKGIQSLTNHLDGTYSFRKIKETEDENVPLKGVALLKS